MAANSDQIAMTIRLPRELYLQFRDKVSERGATRVGILRILIKEFLSKKKP